MSRLLSIGRTRSAWIDSPFDGKRIFLWFDGPGERNCVVVPIVARLGRGTSEHPEPDALAIDPQQIGEAMDGPPRIRPQSRWTIEQVLRGIVGGVAGEWLGVNDEPRLALR